MKLLADENIERPVVEPLRAVGHDVKSVAETQPGAADTQVLETASLEGRILVTNDKDFGELVLRLRLLGTGVLLLRLGTEDGVRKAARLMQVLPSVEPKLPGALAVVTTQRVRLRRLTGPTEPCEGEDSGR